MNTDEERTYWQPGLTLDSEALVRFWVPGVAKTQGSKRAFVNPHTGRAMMKEQIKGLGDWRADVKAFSMARMAGREMLIEVPVFVHLYFVLTRPASVPKTKATPPAIKNRGDLDKLTRAIYDALTGIVYQDDKLVIEQFGTKRIAELGEQPGCWVAVGERTGNLL